MKNCRKSKALVIILIFMMCLTVTPMYAAINPFNWLQSGVKFIAKLGFYRHAESKCTVLLPVFINGELDWNEFEGTQRDCIIGGFFACNSRTCS